MNVAFRSSTRRMGRHKGLMVLCGVDGQSKDERRGGSRGAGKVEFVPVQARRVGATCVEGTS